jgi:hypothetical protein
VPDPRWIAGIGLGYLARFTASYLEPPSDGSHRFTITNSGSIILPLGRSRRFEMRRDLLDFVLSLHRLIYTTWLPNFFFFQNLLQTASHPYLTNNYAEWLALVHLDNVGPLTQISEMQILPIRQILISSDIGIISIIPLGVLLISPLVRDDKGESK